MKFKQLPLVSSLVFALTAASSFAATPGSVGATSSGNLTIDVVIPSLIKIDGLQNINLGTYTGTGALTGSSPANVCTNGAATYKITANNGVAAFVLTGATNSETIPYTVKWAGTSLTYNTASTTNFTVESATLGGAACAPTPGKLVVDVQEADLQAVSADSYSDTLVLTVVPN